MNSETSILIVDDEPANIYLLEEILESYNLFTAGNSDEMYVVLEKMVPDLILLDIMMPGKDGLTIASELKKNSALKDIPIIFISAKSEGQDVADGLNAGAEDYIKKPFDSEEIAARIMKVLTENEKKKSLFQKATRDFLTGVYNREYFFDQLEKKVKEHLRDRRIFSIVIIDIDFFKKINDAHGHQKGDEVLREFSLLLKNSLRDYDIIARYGGEEFIFLINGMAKSGSYSRLESIRMVAEQSLFSGISLTFSAGIADADEISDKINMIDELIFMADKRLYKAKANGRNRVFADN